ncbi:MAG TPA: hypothetical protein VFF28_00350 [Candidatus Nanoarchaeia archaeon]|nr:hypothetical protein [Candidatus Nanoarchaeia archaeon]
MDFAEDLENIRRDFDKLKEDDIFALRNENSNVSAIVFKDGDGTRVRINRGMDRFEQCFIHDNGFIRINERKKPRIEKRI